MAQYRQATSDYPSKFWPKSMSPYGVGGLQWDNLQNDVGKNVCVWLGVCVENLQKGKTPSHTVSHTLMTR